MEQDLKTTLTLLLHDQNVPGTVTEAALKQVLHEFTLTHGDALHSCWHAISKLNNNAFNRGPTVPISSKHIRVAKLLDLADFVFFYVDLAGLGLGISDQTVRMLANKKHLLNDPFFANEMRLTSARNGVNWTTLDSEIKGLDPQNVCDELGLNYLETRDIVSISYDIETRHLHVPTVLDAELRPWFVPKPSVHGDLPRAWNWVKDRWGLPEFVHPAAVTIKNPRVELIGTPTGGRSGMDRLSSFTPIYSKQLEEVVSHILSRATAHQELRNFISGSSDVLTLTPREFEVFTSQLYQRTGFKTEVTQASHDGGFDVIAISDSEGESGLLIQAKHTGGVVGIRVIRELLGARLLAGERFRNYMLVVCTTGRFSRPARDAETQFTLKLELVDYDKLQKQLRKFKDVGVTDIVRDALDFMRRETTESGSHV